jgi:hypothetical protein
VTAARVIAALSVRPLSSTHFSVISDKPAVSRESSNPAKATPYAPLTNADVRKIFYA